MYERFYDLRERPFALSPDPDYLYPSRVHREALDYLRYGLESHAGFVVITGEIGSGKTTLVQTLLRGLDNQTTVGRVVNTMLEPRELIETIMIDFGLETAGRSKPHLLKELGQYLVDQRLAGRMVLLVIDEAQNLGLATLEELRMLSNLETEKSKLLQVVLVGQPNLREKLSAPDLEQLRQRITVSYHLEPLDAEETANYINHRLRRAALGAPLEFPRDVTAVIHARSRGVPRIINVICDATLVFGYAEERRQIDLALLHDVLSELEETGVLPPAEAAAPATVPAGAHQSAPPIPHHVTPALRTAPAATVLASPVAATPQPARSGLRDAGVQAREAVLRRDLGERASELDQREQALLQRERELAEQRRILAEEYRLLRAQRAPAVTPSPVRLQLRDTAGTSPARFAAVRPRGWWARLKRMMLGVSAPVVD